jgi:hypothetical protein
MLNLNTLFPLRGLRFFSANSGGPRDDLTNYFLRSAFDLWDGHRGNFALLKILSFPKEDNSF